MNSKQKPRRSTYCTVLTGFPAKLANRWMPVVRTTMENKEIFAFFFGVATNVRYDTKYESEELETTYVVLLASTVCMRDTRRNSILFEQLNMLLRNKCAPLQTKVDHN